METFTTIYGIFSKLSADIAALVAIITFLGQKKTLREKIIRGTQKLSLSIQERFRRTRTFIEKIDKWLKALITSKWLKAFFVLITIAFLTRILFIFKELYLYILLIISLLNVMTGVILQRLEKEG